MDIFVKNGWLVKEKEDILYIYAQKFLGKVQFGILCEASVDDYENEKIKRHEQTRQKKEKDRTTLTATQNANVGPIFLTYMDEEDVDKQI